MKGMDLCGNLKYRLHGTLERVRSYALFVRCYLGVVFLCLQTNGLLAVMYWVMIYKRITRRMYIFLLKL